MTVATPDSDEPLPAGAFWRSMGAFYGLSVLITWILWAPLYLGRAGLGWLPVKAPLAWTAVGTLGPAIAVALVRRLYGGGPTLRQLVVPVASALPATLVAMTVVALTFVLGAATLLTRHPPQGWVFGAFGLYGYHIAQILIGGPLLEEWGWRGFAQPRLQARVGALPAALIVGAAWALWHLPLFLVPTWSSASPLLFTSMLIGLSVTMAWGMNLAKGWIVVAIAMHFVFNASSRVLGAFLGHADLRPWPDTVTATVIAFAVVGLLLTIVTGGRLGGPRTPR